MIELYEGICVGIGVFASGFCFGAAYAYFDCLKEVNKRLADGRLVERV